MARVTIRNDVSILSIREFLGLNENPDGSTVLKTGEFSAMKNFKITKDRHLRVRDGCETLISLADAIESYGGTFDADDPTHRVYGVWRGYINDKAHVLVQLAGYIIDVDVENETTRVLGTCGLYETTFIGFANKVYLLNGHQYYSWDGGANTQFSAVFGYVPIIRYAMTPAGEGTELEQANRLTAQRRVLFSPDGTSTEYHLPEAPIQTVSLIFENGVQRTDYTTNLSTGVITFQNGAPTAGTNTVEVWYTATSSDWQNVWGMRFAELYNGETDTRMFLYGNGSNVAIYSGIPYDTGMPSGEYFPMLNEISVGEENTPITALVRHYSRMMAFKPDSAYSVSYGTLDLTSGTTTAAFYVQPVNRQIGNEAPGQVRLMENNPLTIDTGCVYQWSGGRYNAYISASENNAKRISGRVEDTLRSVDVSDVRTENVKNAQEFWFMLGDGKALIYNYANDTWYYYDGLPYNHIVEAETELYGATDDGRFVRISKEYRNDDGTAIDCYAETGAMDFNRDWLNKYSPMLFVAMQPEANARVYVSVESNRRSDYPEKLISYGLSTFENASFSHWSFGTNRKPQVRRVKIKVKKATYYRVIYKINDAAATATIIQTDIKLRYGGAVK